MEPRDRHECQSTTPPRAESEAAGRSSDLWARKISLPPKPPDPGSLSQCFSRGRSHLPLRGSAGVAARRHRLPFSSFGMLAERTDNRNIVEHFTGVNPVGRVSFSNPALPSTRRYWVDETNPTYEIEDRPKKKPPLRGSLSRHAAESALRVPPYSTARALGLLIKRLETDDGL